MLISHFVNMFYYTHEITEIRDEFFYKFPVMHAVTAQSTRCVLCMFKSVAF